MESTWNKIMIDQHTAEELIHTLQVAVGMALKYKKQPFDIEFASSVANELAWKVKEIRKIGELNDKVENLQHELEELYRNFEKARHTLSDADILH